MRNRTLTLVQAALTLAWLAPPALLAGAAGPAAAGGLGECAYASDKSDDVATYENCAEVLPSGALRLGAGRLDHLRFDDDGLAIVQVGKFFFCVNEQGRSAPVAGVEGHAVGFNDGLAPSPRRVGGGYKIGYIDKHLALAIPARWDGGLDFDSGRAEVCRGCTIARDGDFAELQGGRWGCIDTDGREVVPVTQPSPDNLDCAGN
jgi:hypothetical protein